MTLSVHLWLKLTFILLGLFCIVGCAHSIRLKVIDAGTSQPLEGVSTVFREDGYNMLLGKKYQIGPTNLPTTAEGGVIIIHGLYNERVSRFIFSYSGYATLYGFYADGKFGISHQMIPLSRGQFIVEEPQIYVSPTNGYFQVPMSK